MLSDSLDGIGTASQRSMRFLVAASGLSSFGVSAQTIGNTWLIMQLTGNPFSVGLLLSFSAMPGLLLAPIAGTLVDNTDGRRIGSLALLLCCAAPAFVVLLYSTGIPIKPFYLYALEFCAAVGYQLYNPCYKVLVRYLSAEGSLLAGNASISISNQIGNSSGAMLGGTIVAVFSPYAALALNAACLFIAGILVGLILVPHSTTKRARTQFRIGTIAQQIVEGAQYLMKTKELLIVYGFLLFVLIEYRLLNAALPSFSKEALQLSAGGYGLVQSSFAAGALFGGLALPLLPKLFGQKRLYLVTISFYGASIFLFSLSSNIYSSVSTYFLVGASFQCWIFLLTKTQEMTPLPMQGRVYGLFTMVLSLGAVITFVSSDYLLSAITHRYVYVSCGVATVLLAIAADVLRQKKRIPR